LGVFAAWLSASDADSLGGAAFPSRLRTLPPEFWNPQQVVGSTGEHKQPLYLGQASQFHLAQAADLFHPPERLFHQPPLTEADLVSSVPRGSLIDE